MWQALRLGAGWGISSEPCDDGHWTEQTWRVFEAVDYRWSGDLEPVARLGQLVGRHVDSGGQDAASPTTTRSSAGIWRGRSK